MRAAAAAGADLLAAVIAATVIAFALGAIVGLPTLIAVGAGSVGGVLFVEWVTN